MHKHEEFIIKVYEDGNIRIPMKIRQQLDINKGNSLVLKLNKNGGINIDTVGHKIDTLRDKIQKKLGATGALVDEFLEFKKTDNSKYI